MDDQQYLTASHQSEALLSTSIITDSGDNLRSIWCWTAHFNRVNQPVQYLSRNLTTTPGIHAAAWAPGAASATRSSLASISFVSAQEAISG